MKKYILWAAVALAAVSCNKPDPEPQPGKASLSAEPRSLQFAAASAPVQTIKVTAEETEWEHSLSDNSEWITLKREGDNLSVSVRDNETETARTATVTISATVSGVDPVKVTVGQAAKEKEISKKPSISATPQTLTFAAENASAQEVVVTVTGDITWRAYAAGGEDWIHVTLADGKFSVKVDDNPKSLQRAASINVSPSDKTMSAIRVHVIQEPLPVEAAIIPILPGDATLESGLVLPFSAGTTTFALTVEPQTAQWSAEVEEVEGKDTKWLSLTPIVAEEKHQIFIDYKENTEPTERTAKIVFKHSDPTCEPVILKLTQQAKADVMSTIREDVNSQAFTQIRVEARGNNEFQQWPYSHWTFTLYTEGISYQASKGQWSGTGERIRLLVTASPQNEENLVVEERTYEVVPNEQYNIMPLTERKPGWAEGAKGTGMSFWPSGIWYQRMKDGAITDLANAVSGSVTIVKTGEDYTLSWDLVSDAGYKVTGSYTGPLDLVQ